MCILLMIKKVSAEEVHLCFVFMNLDAIPIKFALNNYFLSMKLFICSSCIADPKS
nr:hypothetical protein Iba_chr05bCG0120 [Ipomoea batatas]GMC96668.1 hypothetical protein Iba_chr05dCG0120 [Ipomoea batatas]GMC98852.1 hypothetical protein Iba_chr05eCG0090 [Ipomoea batatas]